MRLSAESRSYPDPTMATRNGLGIVVDEVRPEKSEDYRPATGRWPSRGGVSVSTNTQNSLTEQ